MLAFLGDIHGEAKVIQIMDDQIAGLSSVVAGIQVGDFGWYEQTIPKFQKLRLQKPWYWIDGNHEDFDLVMAFPQDRITEVVPNLFYVPRGLVLELDKRRILFCGGAASVDKQYRLRQNMMWHEEENLRPQDIERLTKVTNPIDIMVTHCPPQQIIQRHFDPHNLVWYFDLPITWTDRNADIIEDTWIRLGRPQLFCGHMHEEVVDGVVRILNINQIFCY